MSDSSRPHGLQPTKLLRPWDSPGKVLEWGAIAFSAGMVYIRVKNNEHLDQVRKTLMELCKYLASHRKTNMVLFPLYEVSNSPIQTESRMAITWAEERGTGELFPGYKVSDLQNERIWRSVSN